MKYAQVLLAIPLAATILVALTRATVHFESGWSVHAQHHLVHQIVLFIGFSVVGFMLLYGPLARRERWAWWAMLVVGISLFGGFWLGHPLVGFGESGTVPNTAQAVLALLYATGLAVAFCIGFRPSQS